MDDGLADRGSIYGINPDYFGNQQCTDSTPAKDPFDPVIPGNYYLTNAENKVCNMYYYLD